MPRLNLYFLLGIALIIGAGSGIFLHPFIFKTPKTGVSQQTAAPKNPASEMQKPVAMAPENIRENTNNTAIAIPPIPKQKPLKHDEQEAYVLELFSPSDDEVATSQQATAQDQQLERTIAMAYLLTNCDIIQATDYEKIYTALVVYLQAGGHQNATQLAQETASRARASYRLVYRYVPCTDPSLLQVSQSIRNWGEAVLNHQ